MKNCPLWFMIPVEGWFAGAPCPERDAKAAEHFGKLIGRQSGR